MRHFTMVAAGFAVAAAGSAAVAGEAPTTIETRGGLNYGTVDMGSAASRTGQSVCYSSLGLGTSPFDNFVTGTSHGSGPLLDDIVMNKPAGTRIDEITFSVVSFNSDGSSDGTFGGGVVTTTANIAIFNAGPDGSPDFSSPKFQTAVTGLEISSFTVNLFTIDVKDANIIKKDEVMWAGLFFTDTTGPANVDGTPLNDNMGQGIFGQSTKGFSDDVLSTGPGSFVNFGGFPAAPYANAGWEFRSVPTPGAMAIFGLAGVAATRRRR